MVWKKIPALPFLLISLLVMTACTGSNIINTADMSKYQTSTIAVTEAPDTSDAAGTTLAESTAAATDAVLTPVPASAASASLQDGEYMILPGESAYYNVFDSSGNVIGSFFYNDVWDAPSPIGVFDETTLAEFYNPHFDEIKAQIPKEDTTTFLYTMQNGLYLYNYETNEVILYDKDGRSVHEFKNPIPIPAEEYGYTMTCVKVLNGETVVAFQTDSWSDDYSQSKTSVCIYFVAPDGTIHDVCKAVDLPGKPVGLIDRKYYMVSAYTSDETEPIRLYDFSGNPVDEGVEPIQDYRNELFTAEGEMSIYIGDYYIKGQEVFGADLKPVEADSLDINGNLIFGIVYHVNGVDCKVTEDYYESPVVAIGYKGDTISLKTADFEFSEDSPGYRFSGMNENTIVFSADGDLHFISKLSGKEIALIENNPGITVMDEYIVVYENSSSFYIIDKEGNRRYGSTHASIGRCTGEYVLLYRGPYIGIADLDGNWVQKALTWELTRDRKYDYGY